jgi:acyl-CoA-dependent ceramide synthase
VNELFLEAVANAGGVQPEKRGRFKDQGWQCLYYIAAFISGFSLLRSTEWGQAVMAGDTAPLFQGYPVGHIELSLKFKLYYLLQLSFWVHQLFVLYIEEWRKDMPLYLFHHVITIGLISVSYLFNFTRVGTAILVEQDFADIFLPIALMLKYLEWETACEAFFALFAIAWIPTRHVILPWIYYRIWTLYDDSSLSIAEYDPGAGSYMSPDTQNAFLLALGIFQCLLIMWLKDLIVSIYRAVTSGEKED